jgi:hypothetical protein
MGKSFVDFAQVREHFQRLGVVGDGRCVGAGQDEAHVVQPSLVPLHAHAASDGLLELHERLDQGLESLEPIPARDLRHDGAERDSDVGLLVHRGEASISTQPRGLLGESAGDHRVSRAGQAGVLQDARQLVRAEFAVLVAEGIDGRHDDPSLASQEGRDVLRRREDRVVAELGVGPEEVPGRAGLGAVPVEADVTAEEEGHPQLALEQGSHPQRLGIVYDQDVLGSDPLLQRRCVLGAHRSVELPIRVTEPRVARAVDQIVDPFGELEELRLLAPDHQPLGLQPELVQQRDQLGHHLGHPTALRRGVDHPHLAASQRRDESGGLLAEGSDGLGQVDDLGVGVQTHRFANFDAVDHVPSCPSGSRELIDPMRPEVDPTGEGHVRG